MLPHQDAVTEKLTIAQLREPEIASRVGGVSTFYIPPKSRKTVNPEILQLLGFQPEVKVLDQPTQTYPPNEWGPPVVPTLPPYGQTEESAIAELETHTLPKEYRPLSTSKGIIDVLTRLALDPKALARYKANPSAFVQSVPDLSSEEMGALLLEDLSVLCKNPTFVIDSEELVPTIRIRRMPNFIVDQFKSK